MLKLQEEGLKVEEICRKHGISASTFYVWWSKYSGMEVQELRRLRSLEEENSRLKKSG
ncbi:transposase [Cyclobacterium jeungdonense]|uniref:transposase n=1 Tax=Cyclobacterium jeungdonense TaxID=708087 RepID=UPI003F49312D